MVPSLMVKGMVAVFLIVLLNPSPVVARPKGMRYCAKRLAEILQRACAGRGYAGPMDDPDPYRTGTTPKPSKGIVEECCKNPCSLSDLEAYCKPKRRNAGVFHHCKFSFKFFFFFSSFFQDPFKFFVSIS